MLGSIAKFVNLYPEAKLVDSPVSSANTYNCLVSGQWISLQKERLSEHERFLLSLIDSDDSSKAVNNPWWNYLVGNFEEIPLVSNDIRIIQFEIQKNESKDNSIQWLNVFKDTFDNVVDSFLISSNSGILIEKVTSNSMNKKELEQMVQLLDSDFYTDSHVYIGQFWSTDERLPGIFATERQLFHQSLEMRARVNDLSTVILDFLIEQNFKTTDIFKELRKRVEIDSKTTQMIDTLYRCDSNLAKTSKALFLHRNTLLYRIEKFYEQTGFDLKNRDDLVLCFLLLK